jgi:hypothetical protein
LSEAVNRFYNAISTRERLGAAEQIAFFVYFLTVELGEPSATLARLRECFRDCDIPAPASVAQILSSGTKSRPPKFVKAENGYRLQRHSKEELARRLGAETVVVQASVELRLLENNMQPGAAKAFLKETIDCFEAGANRATVVMCWLLVIDHLQSVILNRHLATFNGVLAQSTDKRIKITAVHTKDDFGEIPEGKFIEFARSAGVISNDVRKILDEKLGTRNSCAHPSGVQIRRDLPLSFFSMRS